MTASKKSPQSSENRLRPQPSGEVTKEKAGPIMITTTTHRNGEPIPFTATALPPGRGRTTLPELQPPAGWLARRMASPNPPSYPIRQEVPTTSAEEAKPALGCLLDWGLPEKISRSLCSMR